MTCIWTCGRRENGVFIKVIQKGVFISIYTYVRDSFSKEINNSYICLTVDDLKEIIEEVKED